MQKVLHVGPDSCTVISNLLKEGKEAWGVEPYDLEDAARAGSDYSDHLFQQRLRGVANS